MNVQTPQLEPAILVIFGITGDLAKRKLLPSLYHLVKDDLLHEQTEILGVTRGNMTLSELLETIELCVNEADGICDPVAVKKLQKKLSLRNMDVTKPEAYDKLLKDLNAIEEKHGVCMNRLYYLSIPPLVAEPIVSFLGEHGHNKSCQHNKAETRLLLEKPFGFDLQSAQELVEKTAHYFHEDQVYRIDHYLAKETVQNILTFRFNNPIFQPLWDAKHIEYIEVFANEKIGIEGRASFYEQTGAVRDLIQSHLLQVLALVTMEQPDVLTSEAIHANKEALMKQIRAVPANKVTEKVIRGQYEGYRKEVDNLTSSVETFAALQLVIDNPRWKNMPIIVRSGKALNEKASEVNVVFKPTPETPHHNVLTFRIQPDEGIELGLRVKKPGFENEMQHAEMDFSYKRTFSDDKQHDAYERVLVDAFKGDHTLFATSGEILESWRVVQPILDEWSKSSRDLVFYKQKSAGPKISALYP